jgi:hypothetical protein
MFDTFRGFFRNPRHRETTQINKPHVIIDLKTTANNLAHEVGIDAVGASEKCKLVGHRTTKITVGTNQYVYQCADCNKLIDP